jgi:excinuclease ABC subunit A
LVHNWWAFSILDEPSIGFTRDNDKLIHSLEQLRDIGNSVIVVEHDKDMIERADYVMIWSESRENLEEIISIGTPAETLKSNTITAQYLNGEMKIEVPSKRREQRKIHETNWSDRKQLEKCFH